MQTLDAFWRTYLHAGLLGRAVALAVVLLAANRLARLADDLQDWLTARYERDGWRVRRSVWAPGAEVLCTDGRFGSIARVLRFGCGPSCCPPVAMVRFEDPRQAPRAVPLALLTPVPQVPGRDSGQAGVGYLNDSDPGAVMRIRHLADGGEDDWSAWTGPWYLHDPVSQKPGDGLDGGAR